jgi:hypothetical protein
MKNPPLVTGLGSVLFLVATFLPYSRVFAESSPDRKMDIIMNTGALLWS